MEEYKMHIEFKRIITIVIVTGYFLNHTFAQNNKFDYENWPGKDGIIKTNIEFPAELIKENNMSLASGKKGTYFFYKVPLYENDTIKNGRLQTQVFSSIDTAQLALVNYLNTLTTPYKPPRLTYQNFKAGDVAFGENKDGILWMAFTRNNVIVIVHAQSEKAGDIANKIDSAIQNAPEWKKNTLKPLYILTNQL